MAYNKEHIFEQAIKIIEKDEDVCFVADILTELPISKPTFYDYFKVDSNELNTIKEKLEANRTNLKRRLRRLWYKSNSATTQVALYKLLSINTPDEARALNNQSISVESFKEQPLFPAISPKEWV